MRTGNEKAEVNHTQRIYARLAGALFLGAIRLALGSGSVLSHVAGNGNFAETAARIAASERLYRLALSSMVIVTFSSAFLAFALYVTLKPVDSLLAQLALIFSLGDSFVALVVRMCAFVRLHFCISPQGTGVESISREPLTDLLRSIAGSMENLGGISFGIGSILFFYLFFKSRYMPRVIPTLGLVASVIWTGLYFANLVFPEHHTLFQYLCFPPMALAEIVTGFYLMLFAVGRPKTPADPASSATIA